MPMDVMLIDPQYPTAMPLDDKTEASARVVWLIAAAADQEALCEAIAKAPPVAA